VPRTYRDGTLLSRYRNGAFKEVWEEIHSAGEIEGDFRLEVMEVADATMARVAENTDLIAERLRSAGWKALSPEFSDLRSAPKDSDVQIIAMIEEQTGAPIPVALHSFWMIVGGINWVWNYNTDQPRPDLGVDLPLDQMDPLLIEAPGGLLFQLTDLQKRVDAKHPELGDPFDLELAPDVYHKANISGGFPYAIQLPTRVADPIFAYEPHCLPFTDYLRLAFQWCGFPGLEKYSDRFDVRDFLERFGRADLKPF